MSIPVTTSTVSDNSVHTKTVHTKTVHTKLIASIAFVGIGVAGIAVAAPLPDSQDKPKVHRLEPKGQKEAREAARPQVDPMLKQLIDMSQPGKEHEALKALVGTWSAKGRVFTAPDADPWPLDGTMVNTLILGDRYLQSEWQGALAKQKFWGRGLDGYDNVKQKHFSQWIDSINTGISISEGTASEDGRVRTMFSEVMDPASGGMVKQKTVTRVRGYNSYSYESSTIDAEGKETKSMEILFTREAAAGDQKRREGTK